MIHKYIITVTDEVKGFDKAIEQLDREWGIEELEPCEDCISRQEAIKEFQVYREYSSNRSHADWVDRIETVLMDLPSVTPKASEDCISREAVLALAEKGVLVSNGNYQAVCKAINDLPSVMPKGESESDD